MGGTPTTKLSFLKPGIALITLDNPDRGANILSQSTLSEIEQHLDSLETQSVNGLIFWSAKPGMFIAGADLGEFVASLDEPGDHRASSEAMCHRGQQLFRRLASASYVTVAAIDGICVGGGTELSLWCDRRVVSSSPRTEIGLPEVKIGLMPGWGGSVRLPRIIGLAPAVEVITSGESVRPADALQMGLVSNVVAADQLLISALELVELETQQQFYLKDREKWNKPIQMSTTELAFLQATASAMITQQTFGNYPAPVVAMEIMMKSALLSIDEACAMEAQGLAKLFGGEANRSLLNVFFLTDRSKKDPSGGSSRPAKLQNIGVVGAGIMGSGIAAAHLKKQSQVIISDSSDEALQRGVRSTLDEVAFDRATKAASPTKLLEHAPALRSTNHLSELANCELVIEAVVEKINVKQQVFEQLEAVMKPGAILATNTSTIPITLLAKRLKHPERFCGIHFFNPVRRMMLVEVIRGPQTSDSTVATAVAHVKKLGKYPVVVNDGPGFLVNRLLFPYMNEALVLVSEGVPIEAIDKAAKKFGMPMGPLELHDMVGMDTALYAGKVMSDAMPDRMISSPILTALVNAGRLGNKSGSGFYTYRNKKGKRASDPEVEQILKPHIQVGSSSISADAMTARLFLPMLLEATHVLAEKLVQDARDVDLGLIFGIGFPPFKGGLLFWADRLGLDAVLKMLEPLQSLGPRFAPTDYLKQLAVRGESFYKNSLSTNNQ
ncbi:MAG: 3-hydroxyacyl-CoA dehydrogenase NAD-binding domain-containing protein [Pirellulales bacterium]